MHGAFAQFQAFFQHYGLLAVFVLLLLENFGLPLPGELALLYAGYHLRAYGGFTLLELIVTGVVASSAGQLTGYAVGRYARDFARRLLRMKPARYSRYDTYFQHHGPVTILFARFVTGLRILAGLLAGVARMRFRSFIMFDICGAVLWVSVVSVSGALLGSHWHRLLRLMSRLDALILIAAVLLIWIAWRRLHRSPPHD
jgi:membrane protein DedA with SNARE-associated domain